MAAIKLAFRLEYLGARALLAVLRALPPAAASNAGGWVARAIGPLLPASAVAHANLRAAMPELDGAARRRIVRGVWENLGRTVGELPHLATLRRDTAHGPGFIVRNEAVLIELKAQGGPVIFCSAHIGNWEFLSMAAASCGTPFAGFYRAASNPLVDALIQALRTRPGGQDLPLLAKGAAGARRAMMHAARGGRIGLLVDQKLNDGIEARFFGLPAMTAPAAATFALRLRCPVVCGHVERLGPARLCLVAQAPLALPDSGDRATDIAALTQQINHVVEGWIRARPESWLWLHRRWPKEVVPVRQRKKTG
jgi:KDO2-lipid IV(A) lauroyltransferase